MKGSQEFFELPISTVPSVSLVISFSLYCYVHRCEAQITFRNNNKLYGATSKSHSQNFCSSFSVTGRSSSLANNLKSFRLCSNAWPCAIYRIYHQLDFVLRCLFIGWKATTLELYEKKRDEFVKINHKAYRWKKLHRLLVYKNSNPVPNILIIT